MADVSTWSAVDESNTAPPPDGWPEFMLPSAVNNSARAMMGAIRRMYDKLNDGTQVLPYLKLTGGTVSGAVTFSAGLTTSTLTVNSNANISGAVAIGSTLVVGGTLSAPLVNVSGTVTGAGITSTGNVNAQNVLPPSNNTGSVGNGALAWNTVVASTINCTNANASGTVTGAGIVSTGNVTAQNVLPHGDNAGLVGNASLAWNTVVAYSFATKSFAAADIVGALPNTLPLVEAIEPQAFQRNGVRHWGFTAQDVPVDLVREGGLAVDYGGLTAMLWQAVRSLAAKVQQLEANHV